MAGLTRTYRQISNWLPSQRVNRSDVRNVFSELSEQNETMRSNVIVAD